MLDLHCILYIVYNLFMEKNYNFFLKVVTSTFTQASMLIMLTSLTLSGPLPIAGPGGGPQGLNIC